MKSNEELFQKLWKVLYPEEHEKIECDPEMRRVINWMYDVVSTPEPDYDDVWERMRGKSVDFRKHKSIGYRMLRYAAMIALPILLLGGAVYMLNRAPQSVVEEVLFERPRNAIYLTLSDGVKLNLRDLDRDKLIENQIADIRKDSVEGLVYEKRSAGDSVELYNTLIIPAAADYRVRLSDGTIVYLNSETKLRFPVVFSGSERKVYLDGEAYFEVARDAEHPFKVEVCGVEIEVLGTHFNVNSYPEKNDIQTTLAEGSVKITYDGSRIVLSPGEQASCSDKGIKVKNVDVQEFTSWKDGLFIFNKMSLEDIMLQVKRWYGLNIYFFNEDIRQHTFTGMIDKNLPVRETFRVIEKVVDVRFSLKGDDVVVTKQNK